MPCPSTVIPGSVTVTEFGEVTLFFLHPKLWIVNGVMIEWIINCFPLYNYNHEFHGFPLLKKLLGQTYGLWMEFSFGSHVTFPRYFPTLLSRVVPCRPPLFLQTFPPERRQRLLHEQLLLLLTSLLQPRTWKTIHKQVDNTTLWLFNIAMENHHF